MPTYYRSIDGACGSNQDQARRREAASRQGTPTLARRAVEQTLRACGRGDEGPSPFGPHGPNEREIARGICTGNPEQIGQVAKQKAPEETVCGFGPMCLLPRDRHRPEIWGHKQMPRLQRQGPHKGQAPRGHMPQVPRFRARRRRPGMFGMQRYGGCIRAERCGCVPEMQRYGRRRDLLLLRVQRAGNRLNRDRSRRRTTHES